MDYVVEDVSGASMGYDLEDALEETSEWYGQINVLRFGP